MACYVFLEKARSEIVHWFQIFLSFHRNRRAHERFIFAVGILLK